jgi:hypothetical protein
MSLCCNCMLTTWINMNMRAEQYLIDTLLIITRLPETPLLGATR